MPATPEAAADRRLLLVHAHPDDETIGTGATMAKYAAEGAHVCLVSCTLGEEGEILLPDISHRAADADDTLGAHRLEELTAAMAALGVVDHRRLGGDGRFRDSGMIGTPANERPDCFWRADLLTAAEYLVAIIREVRPQVMITYDDFGGYGHPDHIQAHRVATYAAALAAAPSFRPDLGTEWVIDKTYWTAFPRSVIAAGIEAMRESGLANDFTEMDVDAAPFACDDELITAEIDAADRLEQKMAAMRAHASQIDVEGPFFALSNNLGSRAMGVEYFRLVAGDGAPGPGGREDDLFAGIA